MRGYGKPAERVHNLDGENAMKRLPIVVLAIACLGAAFDMPPRKLAAAMLVWQKIGNVDPEKDGPECKPPREMFNCAKETYVTHRIVDVVQRADGSWVAMNVLDAPTRPLPAAAVERLNHGTLHQIQLPINRRVVKP